MFVEILNVNDIARIYSLYGNTSQIILMNKDNSVNYLGLGYIKMLAEKSAQYNYVFICNVSDNAYAVQAAFRMGFKKVYYIGNRIKFNKLDSIAVQYDAQLFNEMKLQALL
ncbi:hypothetical protein NOVO_03735 [Rickettsiales bacterium Ac37b]|nr:hypothetical protein NOVO_03735 [Rickettsiales bacterium Ac37b]